MAKTLEQITLARVSASEDPSLMRTRRVGLGALILAVCLSSCSTCSASLLDRLWSRQLASADAPSSGGFMVSSTRGDVPYMAALDPQASSTHCNITGQCIPCTREQQETEAACRATGFHQEITCIESFGAHHPRFSWDAKPASSADSKVRGETSNSSSTRSSLKGTLMEEVEEGALKGGEEGTKMTEREKEGEKDDAEDEVAMGMRNQKAESEHKSKVGRSLRAASGESSEGASVGSKDGAAEEEPSAVPHGFRKYVTFESCTPIEEGTLSVVGFEAIMLSLLAVCAPIVYQRKRKATASIAMTRMPSGSRV